jgi:hypothetical protein
MRADEAYKQMPGEVASIPVDPLDRAAAHVDVLVCVKGKH